MSLRILTVVFPKFNRKIGFLFLLICCQFSLFGRSPIEDFLKTFSIDELSKRPTFNHTEKEVNEKIHFYDSDYLVSRKRKDDFELKNINIVTSTKRINLDGFPNAFNPSLIKTEQGLILTFRYLPDPFQLWISHIGIVLLNDSLEPISTPQLLATRRGESLTPSQSEDARIFSLNGKIYFIFNDNNEVINPTVKERRDMFLAELIYEDNRFILSEPLKIFHAEKYSQQFWQKNWVPFEWDNKLLLSYSLVPHEVLELNFSNGRCDCLCKTQAEIDWKWGPLRGGTPACLVDGEYLAFFHSSINTSTRCSNGKVMWHYFAGAYTFSPNPPFEITKMSNLPLFTREFYYPSTYQKRVVFPGGFVTSNSNIYVAYGKDDAEVWIATIDKNLLMHSLIPVTYKN